MVIPETGRKPFTLTDDPTEDYIKIPEDLEYEEWERGLFAFTWAKARLDLAFPRYLAYGQLKFGKEKAYSGLEQLEFPLPMVNEAMRINSIPDDIRQPGLTASHYIALARAGLTKKEQAKWARIASEQALSPSVLKQSIEAGEVITPEMSQQQSHGLYSAHGLRGEFDIWWNKRINGIEGIKKMPVEGVMEIADELSAIADAYNEVMEYLAEFQPVKKRKRVKPDPVLAGSPAPDPGAQLS